MKSTYKWNDDLIYKVIVLIFFHVVYSMFEIIQLNLLKFDRGLYLYDNFETLYGLFFFVFILFVIYSFIYKKL